jgi:hypothetical protein
MQRIATAPSHHRLHAFAAEETPTVLQRRLLHGVVAGIALAAILAAAL